MKPYRIAAGALLIAWSVVLASAAQQAKLVEIGIAKTFLQDKDSAVTKIMAGDFKDVMKQTTGLDGKLISTYSADEIAQKLAAKELDFGIFFAHEFVWVQKKHPKLQPLIIVTNNKYKVRAHIVVQKTSPAKSLADLRGKKFDVAKGTIEPARLYVERNTDKDKGLAGFFSSVQHSASPEEGLNEVARGKVDAAVVDTSELENYKLVRGPVFEKNLRVLQESEPFAPALLAYQPGNVDEAMLKQFRDGLLKAHTIKTGKEMMKEWNIDAFEAVPPGFDKRLADVLKAYPPPAAKQ